MKELDNYTHSLQVSRVIQLYQTRLDEHRKIVDKMLKLQIEMLKYHEILNANPDAPLANIDIVTHLTNAEVDYVILERAEKVERTELLQLKNTMIDLAFENGRMDDIIQKFLDVTRDPAPHNYDIITPLGADMFIDLQHTLSVLMLIDIALQYDSENKKGVH